MVRDKKRKKGLNVVCFWLSLPGIISIILFQYVPAFGSILAFKKFNYAKGIFGSPWVGFDNFKAFLQLDNLPSLALKTIAYNLGWAVLVNIICAAIAAIMLYDVRSKRANKIFQTLTIMPNFISLSTVAYIVFVLLGHESGLINQMLVALGKDPIMWYREAAYWPIILTIAQIWKLTGMASLYFYSALLNVDPGLYEAAAIDGANKFQQIIHISLPELAPMACTVFLLNLGTAMNSGLGSQYVLTMDSPTLYPTTDVLGTFLYRGLVSGDIGITAAIALLQALVGIVLFVVGNTIVKKFDPDKAVF